MVVAQSVSQIDIKSIRTDRRLGMQKLVIQSKAGMPRPVSRFAICMEHSSGDCTRQKLRDEDESLAMYKFLMC